MKTAYIGGTFDLLHPGHLDLFKYVKQHHDVSKIVVALNTDEFNLRYKGRLPIVNLKGRLEMLRHCSLVDAAVVNIGDEDSKPAILTVRPDYIVHGEDWTGNSLMKQMGLTEDFLAEYEISLLYAPIRAPYSTTKLIARAHQVC
jgi:cytidyltransferase-like protein